MFVLKMKKCVKKCKSHSLKFFPIYGLSVEIIFFFKLTVKYGCILIMAYKYKYAYKQIMTTPNIIDGYNYDKT